MFVTVQDFVGKYQLSTGMYDVSKLQDYIDKYEKQYLIELFGAELYDEFISDLDLMNVPQSPNFLTVFNPFYKNVAFGQLIMSDGIIEMLKGFIYYEYSKDITNQMTTAGNIRPIGENSENVSTISSMIYTRYNTAIKSYRAIQLYILLNLNQPTGQVVITNMFFGGTGYTVNQTDVFTESASGFGCTLDLIVSGGSVESGTVNQAGQNYLADSYMGVGGGNTDAVFYIEYVGKGNYRNFKGIEKQTAYWI
jgi:hypothetical protein